MRVDEVVFAVGLAAFTVGVATFAYARSQLARLRFEFTPAWDDELPSGAAEVLATLQSAVVVLDTADRVVKVTPAAFALGLVRSGHLDRELLSIVQTVRSTGLVDEREVEFHRVPGAPLQLAVRVVPFGSLHMLVLADDRTEARRAEDVRRDFVANVSHELKTPIGAISLLAETLIPAADDPETVTRFATRLEKESARLTKLVQEIIDLSQLQSSSGLTHAELVDVDEVLNEATDRSRLAAEAADIELVRIGVKDADVFGEHDLLCTAVGNLVDNAIRYSDPGTRVEVGVTRSGDHVAIEVRDQGIGISAADVERIFERFYRVDPARSRQTGGTGLGLSIVKHIAANHGGEVVVDSELGRGSTFTLRLPVVPRDRGEPPRRRDPVHLNRPMAGRARKADLSAKAEHPLTP